MSEIPNFDYSDINSRIIEGTQFERSMVARELARALRADDTAIQTDPLVLSALVTGYEESYASEDYSTAHDFAIGLSLTGNEVDGPSRIAEICLITGEEFLAKAEAAAAEENYRRASDKAVWAAERFSEARRFGATGVDDKLMQAARLTIRTAALHRSHVYATDSFEDPILSDLNEEEAQTIKIAIESWRRALMHKSIERADTSDAPWLNWLRAYDHAAVIHKYSQLDRTDLLNYTGLNAFEAALKGGAYDMASYIASFKLEHLTEAEQSELVRRIPTT